VVDSLVNPEVEAMMKKIKIVIVDVQKIQTIFTNTFQTLKPRERALTVKKIKSQHKEINDFILGARKYDLRAPALKFGLENIKQKYQMLMTLWRRTERLLEEAGSGGGKSKSESSSGSPTTQAVADSMITEFKDRLDSAYKSALEKSGAKDLHVSIVQIDGKIKVRMEPK
jgi:hypothetical protein